MKATLQSVFEHTAVFPLLKQKYVREAVLEIRTPLVPFGSDTQNRLGLLLKDYPNSDILQEVHFNVIGKDAPTLKSQELRVKGFRFNSTDRKKVVRFQGDAFAFSWLEPYENWDVFIAEAMRLWQIHCEIFAPKNITRLGVRYINAFPIEAQFSQMEDYFRVFPDDLPESGLQIKAFILHQTLIIPHHPFEVNLIKTSGSASSPDTPQNLILDIDVYTLDNKMLETNRLEDTLKTTRQLKNYVFFGSISENLLERMKK